MSIFRKKEDSVKLPDLPSSKFSFPERVNLPPIEAEEDERHSLPAFPDSPSHNRFSQAAIKDAISDYDGHTDGKDLNVVEMEEWKPSVGVNLPRLPEMVRQPMEISKPAEKPSDVFVRLDKFHSAKKSLSEIKNDLEDVNEMLKKIRETKLREEQELASWERDILQAKARLENVSDNIFRKSE